MGKTPIALALVAAYGTTISTPIKLLDRPTWYSRYSPVVKCGDEELIPGIDYVYDAEKGTVRFLRPINGTVNIVSRFKPQGAKNDRR